MKTKLFSMGLAVLFVGMLAMNSFGITESQQTQIKSPTFKSNPIETSDDITILNNKYMITDEVQITTNPASGDSFLPIRIDNNFELANESSSGDGTINNPYIIENLSINGTGYGYCIYVGNTTDYFIIQNCYVHNSTTNKTKLYYWSSGIFIANSTHGLVINNEIEKCMWYNVVVYNSNNITFDNNIIHDGYYTGIICHTSSYIYINNSIIYNFAYSGVVTYLNSDYIYIENNTIYNELHVMNVAIELNDGCDYAHVKYNNITDWDLGLEFLGACYNVIQYNNITKSDEFGVGIYILYDSRSNLITNNVVGGIGVAYNVMGFSQSNYSIIYNNYFYCIGGVVYISVAFGSHNTWNSSYPIGGNYYSDYSSYDNYSGVNQDIPGSDGIGDIPKLINSQNIDSYPLMYMFSSDITIPTINQTTPISGTINVDITFGSYSIQFSEPMNNSVGLFTTNLPNLTFDWSNDTIWVNGTFGELDYNTTYYANLTNFEDLAGNPLGATNLTFTTETESETTPQTNETITDIIINLVPVFITIVMVMFILRFISTIIIGKKKD